MRKSGMLWITLLTVFLVAATGSAETDVADQGPQAREKPAVSGKKIKTTEPVKRFMGEMVSMDMGAKTITARGRKGESVFDFSNARIARNMNLEDLKPGDKMGIVYTENNGKKVAKVVGKPTTRLKRAKGAGERPGEEKPLPSPETGK